MSGPTLDELLAPALAAYGEELNRHDRITPGVTEVEGMFGPLRAFTGRCSCGWETKRAHVGERGRAVANRAAGLHVTKAGKRAVKAYDAAASAAIEAR